MARKTKEEALKTRNTILDAAIQVFSVQGVTASTLSDIAKEAGVTRGAIYWHFKNKDDLLSELWEQALLPFGPIRELCEDPDNPDPLGKMLHTFHNFFMQLKEDKRMRQLFQILLDKCEAVKSTEITDFHRLNYHLEGQRKVELVLSNAVRHGQLPKTLDVRLASVATLAFIDGLVTTWTMSPELLDTSREIPAMLDALAKMLHHGFAKQAVP